MCRCKQSVEVAHVSTGYGHSCDVVCLLYREIAYSISTMLNLSPGCPEARAEAVVIWNKLLGSAKQYIFYICVKDVEDILDKSMDI